MAVQERKMSYSKAACQFYATKSTLSDEVERDAEVRPCIARASPVDFPSTGDRGREGECDCNEYPVGCVTSSGRRARRDFCSAGGSVMRCSLSKGALDVVF